MDIIRLMYETGCTTNGSLYHFLIHIFLSYYGKMLVKSDGVKPEVAPHAVICLVVECYTVNILKSLSVYISYMSVMLNMFFQHCHLSAAYSCTDIAHPVVEAYLRVLIIGVRLSCLRSKVHYVALGVVVRTNQGTTSACCYHLVAVEAQNAILSKCAYNTAIVFRAKSLGRIFNQRYVVFLCHGYNLVYLCRHAIKIYEHNSLGLLPSLLRPVNDGSLQQLRIHVPSIFL